MNKEKIGIKKEEQKSERSEEKTPGLLALREAAGCLDLTPGNAVFRKNGDFPALRVTVQGEEKDYPRVLLVRAFPFDLGDRSLSVTDEEEKEIGMIEDLSLFDEETATLLRQELDRRYYTPKILEIYEMKERFGFAYFRVRTDRGDAAFTVRDIFRNLFSIGEGRLIITDVDGSRFEIENAGALDKKSRRRIEHLL